MLVFRIHHEKWTFCFTYSKNIFVNNFRIRLFFIIQSNFITSNVLNIIRHSSETFNKLQKHLRSVLVISIQSSTVHAARLETIAVSFHVEIKDSIKASILVLSFFCKHYLNSSFHCFSTFYTYTLFSQCANPFKYLFETMKL